tara:strand:- start:235308 stop:235559 length:252 start_codon:yes stop_codon:yes gene_type:complete
MKKLFLALLVLGSFSTFAQTPSCEAIAMNEILTTPTVKEKIQILLTELSTVDSQGNITINPEVKKEIEDIQYQASVLAQLSCQ